MIKNATIFFTIFENDIIEHKLTDVITNVPNVIVYNFIDYTL